MGMGGRMKERGRRDGSERERARRGGRAVDRVETISARRGRGGRPARSGRRTRVRAALGLGWIVSLPNQEIQNAHDDSPLTPVSRWLASISLMHTPAAFQRALKLCEPIAQSWAAVHVAGTNGKGSICSYISSALRASGVKCGSFTSPHLIDRYAARVCPAPMTHLRQMGRHPHQWHPHRPLPVLARLQHIRCPEP
jgi:hypothetical protein